MAAIAASGCTQGDTRDGDDFQGTCPAWVEGLSSSIYHAEFHPDSTDDDKNDTFGGGGARWFKDHPLDILSLSFYPTDEGGTQGLYVQDGVLTATFSRADTGEPLAAYDIASGPRGPGNPGQSVWTFQPKDEMYANFTLQIDLSDPGEEANPGPVRVDWHFERDLDGDPDTPSAALVLYTTNFWYRTCE